MTTNNNTTGGEDDEDDVLHKLVNLHRKVLRRKDVEFYEIRDLCSSKNCATKVSNDSSRDEKREDGVSLLSPMLVIVTFLVSAVAVTASLLSEDSILARVVWESRCTLQNNFLVMEATRPECDCRMCSGLLGAVELRADQLDRDHFARLAYASRPVIVRGGAANWTAMKVFGFDFFRRLYEDTPGAYEAVERECQFFPFNTDFTNLKQVFAMSPQRAAFEPDQPSWYIGWSNCDPRVAAELRRHYQRPSFLPEHADCSAIDWIFMGGAGPGASMHLDYVSRPSWQAQVSGSKTWELLPPPECEHLCQGFAVTVNTGDIVLIDTNQWYHNTHVNPGAVSITIGSEYG